MAIDTVSLSRSVTQAQPVQRAAPSVARQDQSGAGAQSAPVQKTEGAVYTPSRPRDASMQGVDAMYAARNRYQSQLTGSQSVRSTEATGGVDTQQAIDARSLTRLNAMLNQVSSQQASTTSNAVNTNPNALNMTGLVR